MRSISQIVLVVFLFAVSGLCMVQWGRESELREIAVKQRSEKTTLEGKLAESEARAQAGNAEILRLTGALSELRTNSVAKAEFDELKTAAVTNHENVTKQNEIIRQQNESITKANEFMQKANESIKALTTQRDELARKVNEVTDRYNKLANQGAPE